MTFSASFSLGLCALFLGSAFGCALRMSFSAVFRKKNPHYRVSLLLVSLSLAVAFATVFAVFAREKCGLQHVFSVSQNVLFLSAIFAFGALLSSFWKFLVLPFLVAYSVLFFYTQNFLGSRFSKDSDIPLTIESADSKVNLKIYELPAFFLVPVRRFYCEVENSDSETKSENGFCKWLLSNSRVIPVEIPPSRIYPALYLLNFQQNLDDFDFSLSRTL